MNTYYFGLNVILIARLTPGIAVGKLVVILNDCLVSSTIFDVNGKASESERIVISVSLFVKYQVPVY